MRCFPHFCDRLFLFVHKESKDKFEVTYDAVLRHYCKILENPKGGNLFRRHSDNILDFGTWEYLTESGYSLFVPLLIHKVCVCVCPPPHVTAPDSDFKRV